MHLTKRELPQSVSFYARMKENINEVTVNGEFVIHTLIAIDHSEYDEITHLYALGYEGGGCWSDWQAMIKMDDFNEEALEIIEKGSCSELEVQSNIHNLLSYVASCYTEWDEDLQYPMLKKEYSDLIDINTFLDQERFVAINWNWEQGAVILASKTWPFLLKFDSNEA